MAAARRSGGILSSPDAAAVPNVARSGFRGWLADRADDYTLVVTAVGLNAPFVAIALARHLEAGSTSGIAGLYALLVFLGYYALGFLAAASLLFAVTMFSRRLALASAGAFLTCGLFYLILNSVIHGIYRFHVDAFWLQYLFTSYSGLGIPPSLLAFAVGVFLLIAILEWVLFRLARRLRRRSTLAVAFAGTAFAAFAVSQAIHVLAYYRNDSRITAITPQLPFYHPITSHGQAQKYGDLVTMVSETTGSTGDGRGAALRYPLADIRSPVIPGEHLPNILMIALESWRYDMMDSLVSPHMAAFGQRSSVFLDHFSSGNCTPAGVFGLFYGIHPTYWTAVKSNAAAIDNPVMIDVLKEHGYDFGIFADSDFQRHKIKDAVFRGIEVHESFAGASHDQKDRDMTDRLLEFMGGREREQRPYFAFAFYKSTHYSYCYPKEAAIFRPSQKLNIGLVGKEKVPELFLNDYRNSIHYVDQLVGDVIDHLESKGRLENTIVVITSDHGEEFNDNHANYWGHCGNFTQYQTRVPLIFYLPRHAPRRVTTATAHVDLPATILAQGFGLTNVQDYSNGRDLFGPLDAPRPLIVSSYLNHAFIMGDDVYEVFPMYVQKYKLENIKSAAGPPQGALVRQAMEEMRRFYRNPGRGDVSRPAAMSLKK